MNAEHYDPEVFRRARAAKGWTFEEAATAIKMSSMAIRRLEWGKSVSYATLRAACTAYGIPISIALRESSPVSPAV